MKRLLFITMIILLLIFMITPTIVYGAINPENLIIRRENSENLNYIRINEKITTNLRIYASQHPQNIVIVVCEVMQDDQL